IISWAGEDLVQFIPWIAAALLMRIVNMMIAVWKFHRLVTLHTWSKKLTGFLVFLIPLLYLYFKNVGFILPICVIAILSAAEEGFIHITSNKLNLNRRSIFHNE
ncbi:MAG TPA: CDP-alcohol phosphatidyltransferase, partial [Peptococcaceae bacterium]|nr:CDP-alcohol phosphatidyltransferase [Peptococcaceae bacterium]